MVMHAWAGTVNPFLICVNKNDVKALVAVRTIEKEVHYLPFLYVGKYKAYNNQRLKAKRCEAKSVFNRNLKCHEIVS